MIDRVASVCVCVCVYEWRVCVCVCVCVCVSYLRPTAKNTGPLDARNVHVQAPTQHLPDCSPPPCYDHHEHEHHIEPLSGLPEGLV